MRAHARWTLLILVMFLVTLVPAADVAARSTPNVADARTLPRPSSQSGPIDGPEPPPDPPPPPDPTMRPPVVAPIPPITVSDGHNSSLHVIINVNPDPITVGGTAVIRLTVANTSPDAADDVRLRLPFPAGTGLVPLPDTALLSGNGGWQWNLGHIDGYGEQVVTTRLLVGALPPGEALVLRPSVTARDLTTPIGTTGGAIVVPAPSILDAVTSLIDFQPGRLATLLSKDNKVAVTVPAGSASTSLRVQYARRSATSTPDEVVGLRRGLTPFFLTATDQTGNDVHQFNDPLTIAVRYTPEQLLVRRISEFDLQLFWFDDRVPLERQRWVPIKTTVDTKNHIATAQVDHFTPFALGDGAKPSEAFIPSVKGWQVSLFTGSATYAQSLDVPAGPAGIKPDLGLSYNSAATDGLSGMRREHQAGWVGKGWSLDTGAVSRNKTLREEDFFRDNNSAAQPLDTFSLVFNGQAIDVVRGERTTVATSSTYEENAAHLDLYKWRSTDETFTRIEAVKESQGSWNYAAGQGIIEGDTFVDHDGVSTSTTLNKYGRGGSDERFSTRERPRYSWHVWTKDGMKYEFKEDLWYGWHINTQSSTCKNIFEPYKWLLSSITDTHGNTILYNYHRKSWVGQATCDSNTVFRGTVDVDAWPVSITWGYGSDPANHRHRVRFLSSPRPFDTEFKAADVQYTIPSNKGIIRETRQLDEVVVESKAGASWQNVRSYLFKYALQQESMTSDYTIDDGTGTNTEDTTTRKITLTEFQLVGNDREYDYANGGVPKRDQYGNLTNPGTGLPKMTFTYGRTRGTGLWTIGDWNRLKLVDNGQGGKVGFEYTEIEPTLYTDPAHANRQYRFGEFDMGNYRRVTYQNVWDGLNDPTTLISTTADFKTRFLYEKPQLNSMGTKGGEGKATQEEPNSAILYYNSLIDGNNQTDDAEQVFLMHRPHSEFRGHAVVTEIDPSGAKIRHTFFQGDIENCPQTKTGSALNSQSNNQCFIDLRNREFLKGKPRRTEWYASEASTHPLRWVDHTYTVNFLNTWPFDADMMKSGQWRAWSPETTTEEGIQEGGSTTPQTRKTTTTYESTYGNVTKREEFINTTRRRITEYTYNAVNDATRYIVDRPQSKVIFDGAYTTHALTNYFYDGRTTTVGLGSSTGRYDGNLTLERVYYDAPNVGGCLLNVLLHSTDTSYGYDDYGNQTSATTYDGPGTLRRVGSDCTSYTNQWSAPGNATPGSTTTTAYEPTFRVYPVTYSQSTGAGVTLTQQAQWDYRMGTLQQVTDPNLNTTSAGYDTFGRMIKLWKPGDSPTVPTSAFTYDHTSVPFSYRIDRREESNNPDAYQPTILFYDGLGRQIQTKQEMVDGSRMKITDMFYDGLDRVTAQRTPRYGAGAFWNYDAPPLVSCGTAGWICTSYDGLGRRYDVTAPDTTVTRYRYGVDGSGLLTTTTDANNHRTTHVSDVFDRLSTVIEHGGTGMTGDPYTTSATTQYTYNALDLLTNVTNGANGTTTITYDSAGRKTTMHDPDMGVWGYTYDVAGNLVAQTDAEDQTTLFGYDDLNRMTTKLTATSQAFADDFTTKNTTNWTWTSDQTVVGTGDTVIRNTGTGSQSWEATFARSTYSLSRGEGVQVRFKLNAANTDALFMLEADDPDDIVTAQHPRFGVLSQGGGLVVQLSDGSSSTFTTAELMPTAAHNQWYVLTLGLDDFGGFTAHVYPEGQPNKGAAYRTMLPNARYETWRFRSYARNNSVDVDDYREWTGAQFRYDAGTNGKGQRTSTTSPGVSQAWAYDARGRVTETSSTLSGLSGSRTIQTTYDAADRVKALTYPSGEEVAYTYDAGWRQTSLCSTTYNVCYAQEATFDAQDQPYSWQLGNGLWANWVYFVASRRVYAVKVGTDTTEQSGNRLWLRSGYDAVGNVAELREYTGTLSAPVGREIQSFGYDHRDRLTSASGDGFSGGPGSYSTTFTYNAVGNLLTKDGRVYQYQDTDHPHAVTCANWVGSACATNEVYSYDANGNLESGGGRTLSWTAENQPASVVMSGVSESYLYSADNERVKRTTNGVTTFYVGAGGEESGTTKRHAYVFNGQVIAERDVPASGPSTFRYLHGDHLGSIAATSTSSTSPTVQRQFFTPWGEARHGDLTATTDRNYTGQRKDDTGLLFYNARYYDPRLSRFISPDSIVPGMASGKGGMGSMGVDDNTKSMLTVDFHEGQFAKAVGEENVWTRMKGFQFELRDEDRKEAKYQGGPRNPQALNRYSYVMNNPLRYTDPTGHVGITVYPDSTTTLHLSHKDIEFIWSVATNPSLTLTQITSIFVEWLIRKGIKFSSTVMGNLALLLFASAYALKRADAYYGNKGVDVLILGPIAQFAAGGVRLWFLRPTVGRQHGIYYWTPSFPEPPPRKNPSCPGGGAPCPGKDMGVPDDVPPNA